MPMPMPMPSLATVVRRSLAGHSWIGIVVGGLMYLICLSGTIVVFYQELERWEQPTAEEFTGFDATLLENAAAHALAHAKKPPEHVWIELPTPAMPRASVSTDAGPESWLLGAAGRVTDPVAHEWTHLLLNLHIYLHLPETFGIIVVGILGALLVALVISGFLAYPRVFKDAFLMRVGGSVHLEQVDLHNRLSVWGAPFHLMIGVTGAYFGLVSATGFVLGTAFHAGNTEAVYQEVFGAEPEVRAGAPTVDFAAALKRFREIVPVDATPSFVTIHGAGTPKAFVEFDAIPPGRLLWAEKYRFDARGEYLGSADYASGPAGRQAVYSTYRLHFGHFGGWPVKIVYAVLGLALTIVSATGVNVWLARRKTRDYLNDLWAGTVWGAPASLALTGVSQVLLNVPSTGLFWVALAAALAAALRRGDPSATRRDLCAATAALLGALVVGHLVNYGVTGVTPAAGWVNGGLLAAGVALAMVAARTPAALEADVPRAGASATDGDLRSASTRSSRNGWASRE